MGIGYTADTPLKVSKYGIDSVVSIADDSLLEKLRKFHSLKNNLSFTAITSKMEDYKAQRIKAYLNLINDLAKEKFDALFDTSKNAGEEIREYFALLPDNLKLKQEYWSLTTKSADLKEIIAWAKSKLSMGNIDVNLMTKLDNPNFDKKKEQLPIEFNNVHASLRGYANSNLRSSLVLSAGMNPRLYSYLEQFEDFYPTNEGALKKKIILKVSDFRSAMIQGKFLAKKGLWVSEYRVESGLNCGGHAFATNGYLLGPILAEFRDKRKELTESLYEELTQALIDKKRNVPNEILSVKITAQGGVGTAEEHQFLIDHYSLDTVGWGSPFLLVPQATNVDDVTLNKLIKAKEEDLYLSNVSPLGVPFNNLRNSTMELKKNDRISSRKPGSPCVHKLLASNTEFTITPICTASVQYQKLKIRELDRADITPNEYKKRYESIVEKECICSGLGNSALLIYNLDSPKIGNDVSVCPGPNIAYFTKTTSLSQMVDHIYGRTNLITRKDRPNMFIKELTININYLKKSIEETSQPVTMKQVKHFETFIDNLNGGIDYYVELFGSLKNKIPQLTSTIFTDLDVNRQQLSLLKDAVKSLTIQ